VHTILRKIVFPPDTDDAHTVGLPRLHAHTASQSSDARSPLLRVLPGAPRARRVPWAILFLSTPKKLLRPQVLLAKASVVCELCRLAVRKEGGWMRRVIEHRCSHHRQGHGG
jgi:hypothetical protein